MMQRRGRARAPGTAAALSALVRWRARPARPRPATPSRNQAWFIGFAPAEAPEVAVAVVIEDTSGTGGVVAAPVAAAVMKVATAADDGHALRRAADELRARAR